ncbi:MAG: DUF2752 domain-containing protein, partial [Acidimicrobiia bacterium]
VRRPAWAAPATVAAGAATVLGGLVVRDPSVAGHYPTCPFLAVTGLYCPGCGALRGLRALAGGDPLALVGFNPLLGVAVVLLVWAWLSWTGRCTGWWRLPPLPRSARFDWAVLGVVVAFAVARNLPFGAALAP